MGQKLSKAPVYFTIAQVQFNPILDLEQYLPSIQARMRAARFPDFKQSVTQRVEFSVGPEAGGSTQPIVTQHVRYFFGDIKGCSHFLLEKNSLSFQTTAYDTFEVFLNEFMQGIGYIHEILNLAFIERIGIRYLDAIQPIIGTDELKQYLIPEVLGLSHGDIGNLVQSISETISQIDVGQLISRVVIRNGQIGMPEELAALVPTISSRFMQHNGIHAILDNDAFVVRRDVFSLEDVQQCLVSLHEEISNSFYATVTEHALATWK
jgi:uncharacterized protein (TIGR04255 family)